MMVNPIHIFILLEMILGQTCTAPHQYFELFIRIQFLSRTVQWLATWIFTCKYFRMNFVNYWNSLCLFQVSDFEFSSGKNFFWILLAKSCTCEGHISMSVVKMHMYGFCFPSSLQLSHVLHLCISEDCLLWQFKNFMFCWSCVVEWKFRVEWYELWGTFIHHYDLNQLWFCILSFCFSLSLGGIVISEVYNAAYEIHVYNVNTLYKLLDCFVQILMYVCDQTTCN